VRTEAVENLRLYVQLGGMGGERLDLPAGRGTATSPR
jgi:hypothetical protein